MGILNFFNFYHNTDEPTQQDTDAYPDVKLRRIPFFRKQWDLVKPSILVAQGSQSIQKAIYHFRLTSEQAVEIASTYNMARCLDYVNQVLLRFCLLDTTSEQNDLFPPRLFVTVNNKRCSLPICINEDIPSGVEPKQLSVPLIITHLLKVNSNEENKVTVYWKHDISRQYIISITLGTKRLPTNLYYHF